MLTVRVYYEDTDFTGIVYHASYLRFMERGRTNYLRMIGADHRALFEETAKEAPGFAFVVRSMNIDFLKPARMDDVLEVVTEPHDVKGASAMVRQRVMRGDELLVEAHVRVAFISRRPGAADPKTAAHRHEGRPGRGAELNSSCTHKSGGWNRAAHYICLIMSEPVMKDLVMKDFGFALFETAIGHCGIVWSERGVAGVQLPERNEDATRNRILRRFPGAREAVPPDVVLRAIDDIVALLGGEPRDLTHVTLDTDGVADFNRRVYAIARTIPPGATLSYGEIAERLGRSCSGARRRTGARTKSDSHHRALSSRAGRRRQDRRLLGAGRCRHKTAASHHRRRAAERSDFVRPAAAECAAPPGVTSDDPTVRLIESGLPDGPENR